MPRFGSNRHGPRPINLLRVVIDKRLHAHGAHVKGVRGTATTLRRAADTASTTPNALRESWWCHGREVRLIRMCRATVRRGHRALTGEAADGMESGRTRSRVAALARVMMATVVGEAGDVWRVGGHVVQFP